jgi:predicted Zn finger-like uncharacterized protein
MFTVCPKCALTLVVTAADLRVAQGYVRCGRCLNVFNALARLSEERPGSAPSPSPPSPEDAGGTAAAQPSAPVTDDDTGEIEIELDPSILVTSARAPAAPQETAEPEATADEAEPLAETAPSPATIATPEAPATARPEMELAPPTETPAPAAPAPAPEPVPASAAPASPAETSPAPQTNTEPQPHEAFELVARSRTSLAWRLGAGVLVTALALQIVNHYRDALAASPALGGPVHALYSALGVKLAPRWNVHAYEVRQLGASVAGATPGEIVVHASVKNGASAAQPLPLLRVTLQDRFGNRIAARDVPPRDYLPSSAAPSSLLAAGSRVDATMVFVDPGPQAVGFEIDACLPIAGAPAQTGLSQAVACAHGP